MRPWRFGTGPGTAGRLIRLDNKWSSARGKLTFARALVFRRRKLTVVCEFLGGGFGGKVLVLWPHTLAGRASPRRVVKPACPRCSSPRAQMYSMVGPTRRATVSDDRPLRAPTVRETEWHSAHDSLNPTSVFDDYVEYAALASRHLWRAQRRDLHEPQRSFT